MRLQLDGVEAALEITTAQLAHKVDSKEKISDVLGFGSNKYLTLNRAVGRPTTVTNKIRTTNYEFAIQALYTYFTEFLRGVLLHMYQTSPLQIVGKHNGTMSYIDIARLGPFDRVAKEMVDEVFRKLENQRSTRKLISGVLKGTTVEVDPDLVEEMLMFMELRHILVHRAGRLDQKIIDNYEERSGFQLKLESKMPMNIGLARRAITVAEKIAISIETQLEISALAPET